jgi:hypothetical protein
MVEMSDLVELVDQEMFNVDADELLGALDTSHTFLWKSVAYSRHLAVGVRTALGR